MRRILSFILASAMIITLAACGGAAAPSGGQSSPQDLPAYKVGVIMYDTAGVWAKNIMRAIEPIGKELNVTFEYAIGGTDPEQTITAVQNFGAAGYDGILNMHAGTIMSTLIEICEQNDMFIVTANDSANVNPDYPEYSKSESFAGDVWVDEYKVAYEIVSAMAADGAETFALHGFPYGLAAQMDTRLDGAKDGIGAAGKTIVTEGLSFDKTGAAENIVSQFPDVDAIFSSVETITSVYQPVINAGLGGGKVVFNCFDPGDGTLEAMEEGSVKYATEGTCAQTAIAFILLYNAMSGNRMTQSDGSVASIEMEYIMSKTADEFSEVQKYITTDGLPYNFDELSPFITVIDSGASFDALKAFATKFSLDDVKTRHG